MKTKTKTKTKKTPDDIVINAAQVEADSEAYIQGLDSDIFFISDLQRAVLDGCNSVTVRQHSKALMIVEGYIEKKDCNLIYTKQDVKKAFKYGVETLFNLRTKQGSVTIKADDSWKVVHLIGASQQMMDLSKNLMAEAEKILGDYDVWFNVQDEYSEMYNYYAEIRAKLDPIFNGMGPNEAYNWSEDTDKLETCVRDIFRIDSYNELRQQTFNN